MRPVRLLALGAVMLTACDHQPAGPADFAVPVDARATGVVTNYLVDTGPGGTASTGSSALFSQGSTTCSPQPQCADHFQYLSGKFTLNGEATVESVEAWLTVTFGGSVTVKIAADNAGVPGTSTFLSQTHTVSSSTPFGSFGWVVFGGYNVVLQAGTYWVTFEPVANTGFHGSMQGGAASPLADYAFFADGNNRWVAYSLFNQNPGFGMRIAGTLTTPPDPPTEDVAALLTELRAAVAALDVAQGTRKSLDAKLRAALDALALEDSASACTALEDFIAQVRAQRRKIPSETADALIAAATDIRAAIGC